MRGRQARRGAHILDDHKRKIPTATDLQMLMDSRCSSGPREILLTGDNAPTVEGLVSPRNLTTGHLE
jgi:hypothetical protein